MTKNDDKMREETKKGDVKITVKTVGRLPDPHGFGSYDKIPARKMNGFDRFVRSIFINGLPRSPVLLKKKTETVW